MEKDSVFGKHAVKKLLTEGRRAVYKMFFRAAKQLDGLEDIIQLAQSKSVPINWLQPAEFDEKFSDFLHQGVVAECEPIAIYSEHEIPSLLASIEKPALILILDGITDPHNLGACLRTADAAGVNFVVIPKDKSVSITPTVSKVASGALETVPLVRATNLVRAMTFLKEAGVWIYGAAGEATESFYEIDFKGSVAIVMGREGEGLRRLTREHCDGLCSMPMKGTVESLNVSVAAGIMLYEVVRQRRPK